MLIDQIGGNLRFDEANVFWLRQCHAETTDSELARHRKRLRRMQTQNFIVRAAYNVGELCQSVLHTVTEIYRSEKSDRKSY